MRTSGQARSISDELTDESGQPASAAAADKASGSSRSDGSGDDRVRAPRFTVNGSGWPRTDCHTGAPGSRTAPGSPLERMMRLFAGMGDEFEQALAAQLGPARAPELRLKKGGWGSKTGFSHGCP